jgi:hypothetical protein
LKSNPSKKPAEEADSKLRLLSKHEDVGDMSLQNVELSLNYTALQQK